MSNLEESFIWKPRLCYSPGGGSGALPEKSQHCRGAADRRQSVSTVDNPTPWRCSHSLERNQIACPYRRIVLKGLRCVTMWKKWAQLKWAPVMAKCYWRYKGQALFIRRSWQVLYCFAPSFVESSGDHCCLQIFSFWTPSFFAGQLLTRSTSIICTSTKRRRSWSRRSSLSD